MQNRIRIARGTTDNIKVNEEIAAEGQPFYDTDKKYLYIGDGVKQLKDFTPDDSVTSNHIWSNYGGYDKYINLDQYDFDGSIYGIEIHGGADTNIGVTTTKTYRYNESGSWFTKDFILNQSMLDYNDRHSIFTIPNDGELHIDSVGSTADSIRIRPNKATIAGDYSMYFINQTSPFLKFNSNVENIESIQVNTELLIADNSNFQNWRIYKNEDGDLVFSI